MEKPNNNIPCEEGNDHEDLEEFKNALKEETESETINRLPEVVIKDATASN